jgi:murein DD-endopeptidase MepM/ murein hydrolase activator NlpD
VPARSIGDEPGVSPKLAMAQKIGASALGTAMPADLRRVDVTVGRAGVNGSFADAGVSPGTLGALDALLSTRADLFVHATEGKRISLWLDASGALAGAELNIGRSPLVAALYDGSLAPRGFYDSRGFSMSGPLRARPVDLSRVTSRYGERFDPISGAAAVHHGVDYAVPVGTPVFAAGAARVKARGEGLSAGKFFKLAHAGGFESWYLHLDHFEPGTEVGAVIAQNDVIARSGNTGRSTGPHVHYELHLAGEALDPERTMPIPNVALGPIALRRHRAFIQQLQQLRATQPEAQHEEAAR